MHENGIGGFIVESRPHPDYLGEKWWHDLDILINEAKKRDMKIWLFDDSGFPSGFASGKIRDNHPEHLKIYLAENHIDAIGPLKGSSFNIEAWFGEGDKPVGIVAAKKVDGQDRLDADSLMELTGNVHDGILYWDVPVGNWRVFILKSTRNGGEKGTRDYLNPLEPEPVKAFIGYVHEEHYRRYRAEFGKTIAGFFTDEPRFGNAPSYDARLGQKCMEFPYGGVEEASCNHQMVLPFSGTLMDKLDAKWNGSILRFLPLLWYEGGEITGSIRYTYMDVVSRLFAENYTQQIGDWCRQHGVKLIGHVVEDNGAHARLGYGCGHFFRAIKGQDYSGLDIVYQVWPEYCEGKFTTPFGYLDADFFYWGLSKMASSAGHIDPKKNGVTVCEVFGAYGWQEGLKLMKWLTDHICVRGVNFIIPHAFSPKYPDPDCPPHFYARGANPQWRYFNIWSSYANRICRLLTGGRHVAPVAVIYHAEAEWAGRYMPFEKVVKSLAKEQIDCDIIPIDTIVKKEAMWLDCGHFFVNNEEYKALIVPYSQRLPEEFLHCLLELVQSDIHVIFVDNYPEGSIKPLNFTDIVGMLKLNSHSRVIPLATLAEELKNLGLYDIEIASREEYLRYYHYVNEGKDIFFFTNESKNRPVYTTVRIKAESAPIAYDAMEDRFYKVDWCFENGYASIKLDLEPYESTFILFDDMALGLNSEVVERKSTQKCDTEVEIGGPWKVSIAEAGQYPQFVMEERINSLGNVAVSGLLPRFSGTLRYESKFEYRKDVQTQRIFLDLGDAYEIAEVWVNGKHAGVRICPPYSIEITDMVIDGPNTLCIDVTNTLAKKCGSNGLDRAMPQEPSGLIGPVRLLFHFFKRL